MKLFVGLGNPGKKYEGTRHNAGFDAIDVFARNFKQEVKIDNFKGLYSKSKINNVDVILLKPQTFMNLSGESVKLISSYFKIPIEDIVVLFDDISLPLGKIRVRSEGSAGGQNGVKSIINHFGTQKFTRIRIGIGRDERIPLTSYVLGKFTKDEMPAYQESIVDATNAISMFINDETMDKIMAEFN